MPANLKFIQDVGDLPDRVTVANDKSVLLEADYVLVVLNRALQGENNPVVDAARHHAETLDLPVVVYSELDEQADWANDRLFYLLQVRLGNVRSPSKNARSSACRFLGGREKRMLCDRSSPKPPPSTPTKTTHFETEPDSTES